jgi:hypothetical protein
MLFYYSCLARVLSAGLPCWRIRILICTKIMFLTVVDVVDVPVGKTKELASV